MRDKRISRRTYYRLRADLLPYGIDIANRCNVHTLNIRPRLIEMQPLEQPSWWEAAA
jgi:II/X family phage/plasmid replication protein